MSKYRRSLILSISALAVISSSAFLFPANASALEKPRPLRDTERVIQEQRQVIKKKATTLELTAEEVQSLEDKKKELADKLEAENKAIEDLKRQLEEKKAREEAVRVEAERVAALPIAQGFATPSVSARYSASSAGNSYAWGQCTWYVKNRRPDIGNYWGNANAWVYSARASGYSTGSVPVAGAIGQENGIMHVVYVESVSGGMVNISEMNYAGGVGQVHYRTVHASNFTYIY